MTEDIRDGFDSPRNPVKVIRLKCRDCTCNQVKEIEHCTVKQCPLWPWRMGKNPYRKEMSEEQRKAAGERFKNTLSAKKLSAP